MLVIRCVFFATLVLGLPGWTVPAGAGVRADFNGDGTLDSAALEPGFRGVITLTFSGFSHTLSLTLPERPVALAAADIDRDGRIDLVAASRSRGLIFWRNAPGERFASRPRRIKSRRLRQPFVIAVGGGLHHEPSAESDDGPMDAPDYGGATDILHADVRAVIPPLVASRLYLGPSPNPRSGSRSNRASRAPPA